MPATNEELINCVFTEVPEAWADGDTITLEERITIRRLVAYHFGYEKRKNRAPHRRGMKLLRTLIPQSQREELDRSEGFVIQAPSGNFYRITPKYGCIEEVKRHGSRWFALRGFCIHDDRDDDEMPRSDLSIAHMLHILSDEQDFLKSANAKDRRTMLWNGHYLAGLRRRHDP